MKKLLFFAALFLFSGVVQAQAENEYFESGKIKKANNDFEGAIEDFTKAIEINASFAEAYFERGSAKSKLFYADFKGAIEDYTKAISINPVFDKAYNNRGYCKRKLKDYKGAIADYTKAIGINPKFAGAYYNRGVCRVEDFRDKIAGCQDLRKAVEFGDANVQSKANIYIGGSCN